MSIVDRFGAKVGETAEKDPVRARKLLLAGYRLQEKRLALFPDRKLPMSGQYVAKVVMNNIIQALAKPENAAMVSIFVPGELLTAAGLTPYSVEALSCFMAGTKCEQAFLIILQKDLRNMDDETLFLAYAESLLGQMPCARMNNNTRRNQLFLDPSLKGIIYHTIKFCDYYGFEYASIKNNINVPLLKLETDFTSQSAGQLLTRIQAFAETIEGSDDMDPTKGISEEARRRMESGVYYVAGIDSGSTSTDVVILDQDGKIKSTMIIPTGGGAMMSAEKSLEKAVEKAGISKDDIVRIVTTGYGRAYINSGDDSITEITCHAKGAHYLNPNVRTVIDIGGQDIKAISIDENGAVKNFLMNDKCAAGTGRFLEMMARTLGLSLEEMSTMGLEWKENIVISSMCTVFAESEVVSLVAQNKAVSDIIHGLNMSVASKVGALAARLGQDNPGEYMMTGGVAKNKGITNALEEKLGAKLYICDEAQLCGALGAALFAYEKCREA